MYSTIFPNLIYVNLKEYEFKEYLVPVKPASHKLKTSSSMRRGSETHDIISTLYIASYCWDHGLVLKVKRVCDTRQRSVLWKR